MAKTTTVTTSYTSDIIVNGTAISADKIYANGTQVRRCIVNGTDVIHKFTRTVVTASSDLTLTFDVHFQVEITEVGSYAEHSFSSPIYVDVTVTDNGSSGFTSITLVNPQLDFFCEYGKQTFEDMNFYRSQLANQSLPIGQKTTLTFSYFNAKYINAGDSFSQYTGYQLSFKIQDPDGIGSAPYILSGAYDRASYYQDTQSIQYTINKTLSDNTVQEY